MNEYLAIGSGIHLCIDSLSTLMAASLWNYSHSFMQRPINPSIGWVLPDVDG